MAELCTIYLSSSYSDLKSHRDAAYKTLNQLAGVKVIAMEDYVARDDRPLAACLNDVAACDIYVGLFAWRYGFVPPLAENPEQRSITELEFEAAKGKPRLVFVLKADAPWSPPLMDKVTGENEGGARIAKLREFLLDQRLATEFADPLALAGAVASAVSNQLRLIRPEPSSSARKPQRLLREVTHALYLAHHPEDAELAARLAGELALGLERPVKLSAEALFARDVSAVALREENVVSCHAAAALITPQSLPQFAAEPTEAVEALEVLRARSGALALLLAGVTEDAVPAELGADQRFTLGAEPFNRDAPRFLAAQTWLARRQPPPERRSVGVPVCIVAMTAAEFTQLESDPALLAQLTDDERRQYAALKQALAVDSIDWQGRYRDTRHDWRPFGADRRSVLRIAEEIAEELGSRGQVRQRQRHVRLQWYPFDALLNDSERLRPSYRAVAKAGCVVLVDEVSLFHPTIRRRFEQSPFFNNDQVAIVTVSPFDPGREQVEALLEGAARKRLAGAFDRYAVEYDPQCELAVGDERRLKRWLHASLPATLARLQEPPPDRGALGALATELGESALPKRDYGWGGGQV